MNFYQQVSDNKRKSWFVVIGFILFVTVVCYLLSIAFNLGSSFVWIALIFSGFTSFVGYYYSDKMVLGLSGARPANRKDDFLFYTVTENLCIGAGIPMPKLYVIDDDAMNAFATGRDPQHASVCATTGILSRLNRTQLEGVIAHELSHVRNYDTRLMSVVAILVGTLALLSNMLLRAQFFGFGGRRNRDNRESSSGSIGVLLFVAGLIMALLSPLIAQLIQLAISRRREFLADASGAALTKYPEGLAQALEKLEADNTHLHSANNATAHMYIHSPFGLDNGRKMAQVSALHWFAGLFNTHPPIEERIKVLRSI